MQIHVTEPPINPQPAGLAVPATQSIPAEPPETRPVDHSVETRWQAMAVRAFACLVGGLAGWWTHDRYPPLSTAFFMVAYGFGAWDLAKHTWHDLKQIRFDTHFLMLMVVPSAIAVGAWGEGALLLFLFSASSAMEAFADGRTHREIRSLLGRAPKTARLLDGETESEVPVTDLLPGSRIRIVAGEMVPVDGDVTEGQSACDESTLTGEAEPIKKQRGDTVFGGTMNLWGVLEARVSRPASESALQRIIRLIESSQKLRAPTQRFTDRFGTRYTAFVVTFCFVMFLAWWRFQGAPPFFSSDGAASAFYRAMTLLVVLSPCALVLSVPSAILSAIAFGARHGVLFRGGAAIEELGTINVVAMDKTGTLTEGNLRVVSVEALRGSEEAIFQLGASLARGSDHPVSRSLLQEARARDTTMMAIESIETLPGKGVRGRFNGRQVALGSRELVKTLASLRDDEFPPPQDHTTETWVAGPDLLGRILLRDQLRPQARDLIAQLRSDGVRTVMLTGDRAVAAQRLARESGVDEVRSELKPEQKVDAIEELKGADKATKVAMIGDGVNDAPCIAAADIGVAMGARGSDAAIEQAEVVLMHDRLENFILARNLSRRARNIIRQNLAIALGTIVVMAFIALMSKTLPLSVGVAAHEGSTALVVLNSLRLLFQSASQLSKL